MKRLLLVTALVVLAGCDNHAASVTQEMEKAEQRDAAAAQSAQANVDQFMAAAKARPGAVTTPTGLVYEFTHHSSDQSLPHPSPTASVLVNYEGKFTDGRVFDSSFQRGQPAEFPLNAVVPGFSEAIAQMRPGDEMVATLPGALGYGPAGMAPDIPPNATLQFRIQLLEIHEPGGRVIRAPRS
jgi:FKBP-type peptidyl-prolyl cis-trans isomerase